MIDYKQLRLDARAILLNVSGLPTNRAWENRDFTPPSDGSAWVRETLLPGSDIQVSFGYVEGIGIIQYDLFYPRDSGTEDAEAMADLIRTAFKPGTSIGSKARSERAERDSGRLDGAWYFIPIRIRYRAHATE